MKNSLLECSRTLTYYKYFNYRLTSIIDMIDWEGLLKFSLKYSDGTKQSEFK